MSVYQTGHQGLGALAVNDEGIVVCSEVDFANLRDPFSLDEYITRINIGAGGVKDVDAFEEYLALVAIFVVADLDIRWRRLIVRWQIVSSCVGRTICMGSPVGMAIDTVGRHR